MEQVEKLLLAAIGMEFYCQKNEIVDLMCRHGLVKNKMSSKYMNGASFVQKVLELRGAKKNALALEVSHLTRFELQLYLHILFLENCMGK